MTYFRYPGESNRFIHSAKEVFSSFNIALKSLCIWASLKIIVRMQAKEDFNMLNYMHKILVLSLKQHKVALKQK